MIIFIVLTSIILIAGNSIYFPFLPLISNYFAAHEILMPLSVILGPLIASIVGLFYGRWSDMHGRRTMMLVAMLLFAAGSTGCALSYDIYSLLGSRLIQDLGAGGVNITAIAIAADIYKGMVYTRFLGTFNIIFSLVCAASPIVGAQLSIYFGWRSNFWLLLIIASILIVQAFCYLPETLKKSKQPPKLSLLPRKIINMTKDPTFMLMTLSHIIPTSILIIFTVTCPYIFITTYKFSPLQFSIFLSLPIFFNLLGNIEYRRGININGLSGSLKVGCKSLLIYIISAGSILTHTTPDNPYIIIAILCIAYFGVPYIITACSTKAYEIHPKDKALSVAVVSLWRNVFMVVTVILSNLSFSKTIDSVFVWTIALSILSIILCWMSPKDVKDFNMRF